MTRVELDKASQWLRLRADETERENPNATLTLIALRLAADLMETTAGIDEDTGQST